MKKIAASTSLFLLTLLLDAGCGNDGDSLNQVALIPAAPATVSITTGSVSTVTTTRQSVTTQFSVSTSTSTTSVPVVAPSAEVVYGQPDFTSTTANNGGRSATSLSSPYRLVAEPGNGLFVADYGNNRVLHFAANSATADRVYGQQGNFNSADATTTQTGLRQATAVALDGDGGLYLADYANQRVLHFSGSSTTADRVYGQPDYTSNQPNRGGAVSADGFSYPIDVAVEPSGGLYVADSANSRVLHYPSGNGTTPGRVYGQAGSFASGVANLGGISATSLNGPGSVLPDGQGGVLICDTGNNRVLHYPGISTTADAVYGQNGSFTTNGVNQGGVSAASLSGPLHLALGPASALYVADSNNHRVLHFSPGSTTADFAYGQSDLRRSTPNGGYAFIDGSGFNSCTGVTLDDNGRVIVADRFNNRVLTFPVR